MQGSDYIPVSRRAMDFDDYIDATRRHKAWIFGPMFAGLVIAVVAAFLWPDTFLSMAAIRVTPPQISERMVPSNINTDMSQRISSMAQNILSRATLTNIIQTYGLYPRDIKRLPIEDIIEDMRNKHIKIGDVRTIGNNSSGEKRVYGAFSLSFSYENRYIAQKVCQDLVGRFLSENSRESLQQNENATNFLKEELETARKKLESIESNWTAFKIAYSGRTPEDRQSNLSTLQSIETRLQSINASMSRVNQEKLMLETQQRLIRDQLATAKNPAEAVTTAAVEKRNEKLLEKEREIQVLENNLIQSREHYTDVHPDVKRYEGMLAAAKRQRDVILHDDLTAKAAEVKDKASLPKDTPKKPQLTREAQGLEATDIQLVTILKSKDTELDEYLKEIKRLNEQAKAFQSRLDATPVSDQKFQELSRDYDQAKKNYQDMSEKKTISERATIVTGRKQGETLEMLDPASLPLTPTDPNRYMIIGGGAAAGLLLGLFLAGGREMKDTALKNLKDVRAYTQLTILGCVPLLENDLVVRRRRRLSWLAWSTATILGLVVMAGSVFYYFSTRL